MTERFANLCQALRLALVEIADELGVPKGEPLAKWIDAVLEDDGAILNTIEAFAASSRLVGRSDGYVDGWVHAQEAIRVAAGKSYAVGCDEHAHATRALARELQPHIDKAKADAARERKERGH